MRHTEFWALMEQALGDTYARAWAEQQTITELGSRTVTDALDSGTRPKEVWGAVRRHLGLPDSWR